MKAAIALAALLAIASLVPGLASAQQFTSSSGSILNIGSDAGDLLVRWTETGVVPSGGYVGYQVTGTSQAVYYCTKVTSEPKCSPSRTGVIGQPLISFWLPAVQGGTIRQTAAVDEPDPDCTCSANEGRLVLYSVTYQDMQIWDVTKSEKLLSDDIGSGDFTMTFCKKSNLKNCPPPS